MLLGNRKLSVDGALINAGLLNSIKRYPENGVRNLDRTKFILGSVCVETRRESISRDYTSSAPLLPS